MFSALLSGCDLSRYAAVAPRQLFTIPLGNLPGNFNPWSSAANGSSSFALRDGIFYIGNGERLTAFSSSGVLLDHIAPRAGDAAQSGPVAGFLERSVPYYAYPLESVGVIAARGNAAYFTNTLVSAGMDNFEGTGEPGEKAIANTQLLMYKDRAMRQIIGNEDGQGFNFYAIQAIYPLSGSRLAVLSLKDDGRVLYFFDGNLNFEREVVFAPGVLPEFSGKPRLQADANTSVTTKGVLKAIVPDDARPFVHVQVDYYDFLYDTSASDAPLRVEFNGTVIFRINLRSGAYDKAVPVSEADASFVLAGMRGSDFVLFGYAEPREAGRQGNIAVIKASASGAVTRRYTLDWPTESAVMYRTAYDGESTVGGYFLEETGVSVVWWKLANF